MRRTGGFHFLNLDFRSAICDDPPPMAQVLDYVAPQQPAEASMAQKVAWVLYDWANSGYGLIVTGVLFSNYFITTLLPPLPEGAAKEGASGLVVGSVTMPASAVIGVMTSIIALLVSVSAPVLGALADIRGWTKGLLILTATAGSVLAMLCVTFAEAQWLWAGIVYILSSVLFATSNAFYNAFLPVLTTPEKQGRLSGWGFGVGYVGGAVALVLALMIAHFTRNTPLALAFGGLWWLIFSIPAFILLPRIAPVGVATGQRSLLAESFGRVFKTFKNIRAYKMLFLFLVAFLIYNNGVDSVINLSAAFGTDLLRMSQQQLVSMFLIVQFVAFFGAAIFGYIADWFGHKLVIVSNLVVWCAVVLGVTFVQTPDQFIVMGALIGFVLGGVQSSSRAMVAMLSPAEIRNEAFGFFSLSGKAISIFGPLVYSAVTTGTQNPRTGVFAVLPFLVIGLLLVLFVREPRSAPVVAGR
jgi:UMF1 family MFS transporter